MRDSVVYGTIVVCVIALGCILSKAIAQGGSGQGCTSSATITGYTSSTVECTKTGNCTVCGMSTPATNQVTITEYDSTGDTTADHAPFTVQESACICVGGGANPCCQIVQITSGGVLAKYGTKGFCDQHGCPDDGDTCNVEVADGKASPVCKDA